jgi:hypothetical protein
MQEATNTAAGRPDRSLDRGRRYIVSVIHGSPETDGSTTTVRVYEPSHAGIVPPRSRMTFGHASGIAPEPNVTRST